MRHVRWGLLALLLVSGACEDDFFFGGDQPAAPRNLDVWYYDRAVFVTWDLPAAWNGEAFRVYSKRTSDADFFLIAEVTNCSAGLCSYTDVNIAPDVTYEYYVASVDASTGLETASEFSVTVYVPNPVPPPVPNGIEVIALDGANYIRWSANARDAGDFSFYRVYFEGEDGAGFLLGETDSEGFLDELAENGFTISYFVSSVDDLGHESGGSVAAAGTARPDYHNEWLWDFFDRPELSGFRFQEDEFSDPIIDGNSLDRHFRLETDAAGWWLVPGPGTEIYPLGYETTALKCGAGADSQCSSLDVAPTSGYSLTDVSIIPQTTYVLKVRGNDGATHYAALRVTLQGFDQNDDAIMIFDWAYQLQAGNPNLSPRVETSTRRRKGA